MSFLDKLERKFGKFAIKNLVTKLAYLYAGVYLIELFFWITGNNNLIFKFQEQLAFSMPLVLKGQIWRLVSFIFIPHFSPSFITTIFLFFIIMFMIYMGNTLEYNWGSFRLNLFYLVGIIASIIVSTLTGVPVFSSTYLHTSIFLAFAFIAGDTSLHLYGVIPVKVKYLAYLDLAFMAYESFKLSKYGLAFLIPLVPLVPFLLFFWKDIYYALSNKKRSADFRRKHQQRVFNEGVQKPKVLHKCEVCGVTDVKDPDMEFRYCSKCEGLHEYCINHINNHEHK